MSKMKNKIREFGKIEYSPDAFNSMVKPDHHFGENSFNML